MKRLIYLSVTLIITILTTQQVFSQTPIVLIDDLMVDESIGLAMVNVSLSEPSMDTVIVHYMTESGMASSQDFNLMPVPMQMVFSPGTTSLTLAFEILEDIIDENDEDFFVSLLMAEGAIIEVQQSVITIVDNDAPPIIHISEIMVNESVGAATLTINSNNISGLPISVDVSTIEGTAKSGLDFTGITPTTVVIPAGSISTTFSVSIIDDQESEPTEEFNVYLYSPVNAGIGDDIGAVTIIDNDEDNELPVIACWVDISQSSDPGTCSATVIGLEPVTTDNIAVASVVNDWNGASNLAGEIFPLGYNVVTWTVIDTGGNTATCSHVITVTDDEDPVITCSTDELYTVESGENSSLVNVTAPIALDNCSFMIATNDFNGTYDATDTYPVGTTTVFWTVTDASGNMSMCSQDITVEESATTFQATCPGDMMVSNDPGTCEALLMVEPDVISSTSTDIWMTMYGSTEGQFLFDGSATNFNNGTTEIIFNVQDSNGNSTACTTVVTVMDTEVPQFENLGPQTMSTNVECTVEVPDFTSQIAATDNCGIIEIQQIPSPGMILTEGFHEVLISVTDESGNSTVDFFTLHVLDDSAPVLECQDIYLTLNNNGITMVSVNDLIFEAWDNCGIAEIWATASTFDAADIGVNTVEVIGYDYMGNSAYCFANVTVEAASNGNDKIIGDLDFEMWPNPTLGDVVISKPGKNPGFSVRVMDLTGKIIYDLQYDTESKIKLDLNDLDSGIYTVTLSQGGQSVTKKIIRAK